MTILLFGESRAYTTTTAIKSYLGITSTGDDTLIGDLNEAAQKAIETHCRRIFSPAGDTVRYFTVGEDTEGAWLFLDADLCAITSIVVDADGDNPVTLEASEYITDPRNDTPYFAIKILNSSSNSWTFTDDPEGGIEITGEWAFSRTVPADIEQATIRTAAHMYRLKNADVFGAIAFPDGGAMTVNTSIPSDVLALLHNYRRLS